MYSPPCRCTSSTIPSSRTSCCACARAHTQPDTFRAMARRVSLLLAAEATRDLPASRRRSRRRWLAQGRALDADVVVVPVLRAGVGMLDATLDVIPTARVGHIGLQRDETTAVASQYYAKFPTGSDRCIVFVVDPMLATGGSAVAAIDLLKSQGASDIRLLCIVPRRGRGPARASAPRRPDLHACGGRAPQRREVHRPRARRLRRPVVRDRSRSDASVFRPPRERGRGVAASCTATVTDARRRPHARRPRMRSRRAARARAGWRTGLTTSSPTVFSFAATLDEVMGRVSPGRRCTSCSSANSPRPPSAS